MNPPGSSSGALSIDTPLAIVGAGTVGTAIAHSAAVASIAPYAPMSVCRGPIRLLTRTTATDMPALAPNWSSEKSSAPVSLTP